MRALLASSLVLLAACTTVTSERASDDPITTDDLPVQLDPARVVRGQFAQPIEHDNPAAGTFSQRYYYSTELARDENSPVLLYICGEAPCEAWSVEMLTDVARGLHASVVALEHRFYGESMPYPATSAENLRTLTVANALEDLATFQRYAQTSLPLKGKWIATGGSYPGMLAAFYRLKHPELVVGAWASSAPVDIQKTFWGYDAIASRTMGPACTRLFQQAMGNAEAIADDPAAVAALTTAAGFNGWVPSKRELLSMMGSLAMGSVQGGRGSALCGALEQHADHPLDGVVGFLAPPLPVNNADEADAAPPPAGPTASVRLGPGDANTTREPNQRQVNPWRYQQCTELGLHQVHNPDRSQSIMSVYSDEASFDTECLAMVGHGPDIAKARAEYFEPIRSGQATNILFVNGTYDPWSSLSFLDTHAMPAGTTGYVVERGGHCSDLVPLYQQSLLGDFEARMKVHDLALQWLAQ